MISYILIRVYIVYIVYILILVFIVLYINRIFLLKLKCNRFLSTLNIVYYVCFELYILYLQLI